MNPYLWAAVLGGPFLMAISLLHLMLLEPFDFDFPPPTE